MTVTSDVNRSGPYNGNGVTTVFDYDFRILDRAHLRVVSTSADGEETTLELDDDYDVSGVGGANGGSVTITPAPVSGTTITIFLNVPFTQEMDLQNQGAFHAETIEQAFDLATMRDQQMAEELARSVKFPADYDGPPATVSDVLEASVTAVDAAARAEASAASSDVANAQAASAGRRRLLGYDLASPAVLVKSVGSVVANDWNLQPSRTAAQNRVALEAALSYMGGEGGGELLVHGVGDTLPIEPLDDIPVNVSIRGDHPQAAVFSFNESAGVHGFTFQTPSDGSHFWGGISGCSIVNSGVNKMGKAISTPLDEDLFDAATHWLFERIQFRGGAWDTYMDLGDANQGAVRFVEIRGTYNARSTDVGQADSIGINVSAQKGTIGWDLANLMLVSVRRPIRLGNMSEGLSIRDSELVNCWIGIDRDPDPSRPGGFVDNVHINANHRAIRLARSREFVIGKVLLYRDGSYFDHTGDWKGIEIDGSGGISIGTAIFRVPGTFANDAGMVAIDIDSTSQISIDKIMVREAGGIDKALKLVNTDTVMVGGMVLNEVPTWLEVDTLSQNLDIGPVVAYGAKPAVTPWAFASGISGARKRTMKLDRKTAFQFYRDYGAITAAATIDLFPGFSAAKNRWQMSAGAGAYTYNIDLDGISAVDGDVIELRFHFDNTANPTVNIRQGSGGSTIRSLNNTTGAIWRPFVRLVCNGSGWQEDDYHLSLA
jgi:hypothetical protein